MLLLVLPWLLPLEKAGTLWPPILLRATHMIA